MESYEAYAEKEDVAKAYKAGAEWADETMIDKACEWLDSVLKANMGYYAGAQALEDFRKAMKG